LIKRIRMKEIIFVVEESEEGGLIAKALGVSIFTEAESLEELRISVREAVKCHFDDDIQRVVRLHIVKEEVFAA
jgi:hypothetical protein